MDEGPPGNILATNTPLVGDMDVSSLVSEKQQGEWECPLWKDISEALI